MNSTRLLAGMKSRRWPHWDRDRQSRWLSLKFPDMNIATVAADQESANAEVTADVSVPSEADLFVEELKISFKKSRPSMAD